MYIVQCSLYVYVLALTLGCRRYYFASEYYRFLYYMQFTQKFLDFVGSILQKFWKNASIFHVSL